jgi:two-component system, chemotaxis family, chemotaxis protein CheY
MSGFIKKRILIVDDFETIRVILRKTLNDLGFTEVDEAGDGKTALEMLLKDPTAYGGMVTDWMMPQMTGFDLLCTCRKIDELKKLPIIMITVESEKNNILQAVRAGANGYIIKPFDQATLEFKLKTIFGALKIT